MKKVRTYLSLTILFALGSLLATYFSGRPSSPQQIAHTIAVNLENELRLVEEEAAAVVEGLKTNPAYPIPHGEGFAFYLYGRNQILAWTNNDFVPSISSVADTFDLKLLKAGNSDYLARKWRIADQRFLVAIIPLYRKFNITNDYLQSEWNRKIFPTGKISILDPNATIGMPVCMGDRCPFKISFIPQELRVHIPERIAAIVLISFTIIFLMLTLVEAFKPMLTPDITFCLLFFFLWGLRVVMTQLNFPLIFLVTDLFNPQIFAVSSLNASLGDLLLNEVALFILCFYLFKNLFHFKSIQYVQQKVTLRWVLSVFSGVAFLFAMLFPFVVIQTIYNNSSIIIDISDSIRFDGLRIAVTIVILLSAVCSFLFSHAFLRLLIGDKNKLRIFVCFGMAVVLFVWINASTHQNYLSSLTVGILYFVTIFVLRLYSSLMRLSFATFTYLFLFIFFMSANGAYAMHYHSREEKIENQFRFARDFLIDRDYFAEYLLRELSVTISKDIFIQTRIATPFLSKDAIRQKIRQVFLSSYFNKYDVEIYLFNAAGEPLDNRSDITYSGILENYNPESSRTEYEGVFFVRSPAGDITQKYLVVVPVVRYNAVSGYVVIELSLKKVIPESVYPELLVDNRFLEFYRSKEISYAVFVNRKILYSSGEFNYESQFNVDWIGDSQIHTEGIHEGDYDHIAVEDESGRVTVVSSRSTSLTHALANFSFLLVFGLSTILVFIIVQGLVNVLQGEKLFFAARIQLFLNVAFFLPLIIVSVVTLSVTNRSSENQIKGEYLTKTNKFSEQIAALLDKYQAVANERTSTFENEFANLVKLTTIEANVYNSRGILRATSQPSIFENNLVSNYINASALRKVRSGENVFIETERVGSLEYYIAYASLRSPTSGELMGILGIPFFQSVYSLEKVQINIVANILNIFSLIFIALIILSYFVSEWLTFPLSFITQSLRKTSLTKINQPLVWKSDDEIGLMVKEYNQMLYKLSESKAELEQTQRERVWREIAQQVAHEIKNPLTPMKLTLQQLERALQAGLHNPEKTEKAIASLIDQVNTLNDIASSFSSFAKMPEPVIKRLDIVSVLKRIIDLHSSSGEISFENHFKELYVLADEQLLGRTFSNIILNALQAARSGEPQSVLIKLEKNDSSCLLSFKDEGKGIEPAVAESIFIPHFTTKKSGSGLGLAIAKQAIEHMGGKIWFETQMNVGTTFFIELPLVSGQ